MSLRDTIVAASDCNSESVKVPEWEGVTVYVRAITAQELDSWQCETYISNGKDYETNLQNIRSRLLLRCLVDEKGDRIFADGEAHLLGAKNSSVVERLYLVAKRLNSVTAKDVEDLAKNS